MVEFVNSKKGLGTAQFIGLVIAIVVLISVLMFIFRADISKWLGFVPDYGTAPEKDRGGIGGDELVEGICDTGNFCLVGNAACKCFVNGEYLACNPGQYCVFGTGCLTHLDKFSAFSCSGGIPTFSYPPVCMVEDSVKLGDYCTCPDNLVAFSTEFGGDSSVSVKEQKDFIEARRKGGKLNSLDDWGFSICNPNEYCIFGLGCVESSTERVVFINDKKETISRLFILKFTDSLDDWVYVGWGFQAKSAGVYIYPNGDDDIKKWFYKNTQLVSIPGIKSDMYPKDISLLQNLLNSKSPSELTKNILITLDSGRVEKKYDNIPATGITESYLNNYMYWGNPVALST